MAQHLTSSEIESLVQSGEGYNLEFKRAVPAKVRELSEEICAFANSAGGIIILGVSDDNVIHGLQIDNKKRSAIQNAVNEINPKLPIDFYPVDIESKTVWVIDIQTGSQKPYVLSGAIFVRQGPNTQKLTSVEQMRDFFQQSDRIYFDEAACHDFDYKSDFDAAWFEEFRMDAGMSRMVSQEQIIMNLRLTLPDQRFKNGGVLFFAKQPEEFIDSAVIRCVAFEGTNKTQIFDDKIFGGPLVKQYYEAMRWLKGKLNVRYIIEGGGPRQEVWEIPETAFKEAIINALSHRDYYDKGARITIELFDDRVEVSNPGGLTSAIAPDEFGTKSHSRNPLIFGLFERLDLVERIGSGIMRIIDSMLLAGNPQPVFKTKGIFTVILSRATSTRTQLKVENETTRERIIEMIRNNPKIVTRTIAETLEISLKGVEYHMAKLQKEGILERIGSKKAGSWKLLE